MVTLYLVQPTGKPVKMCFSDFWHFEDSPLAENLIMTEDLDVERQLGLAPLVQMR